MQNDIQERRRYFRITDQIAFSYRVLHDTESAITGVDINTPAAMVIQLENEISASLETLRGVQPQVHDLLSMFNRKINLVLSLDETISQTSEQQQKQAHEVNISACGIAFPTLEPLKPNEQVLLDLTLFPSNICLRLVAAVIACDALKEPVEGDPYVVRADFIDITNSEQEVLVQHIIKRQTVQLKELREARQKK